MDRTDCWRTPRFSDPDAQLYEAFGLVRAEWGQYFNRESLLRMVQAWIAGHGVGKAAGDVQRMPGVFLLQENYIRKSYRHKLVSDRPDYLALALAE